MNKIPVLEIFGPTIQGEGMVIGQKTMFVRTAGCDYSCAWCDSAFTWDGSAKDDVRLMTAEEIWNELSEIGGERFSHVTISGGNPALLSSLSGLLSIFKEKNIQSALETQGSRWQEWFYDIDDLTISPKPPSSNMNTDFEKLDAIIQNLIENESKISLKVVVFNDDDLQYAKVVHHRYPKVPFYIQTGNPEVMEENTNKLVSDLLNDYEILIDKISLDAELNQVRVLPQLHTLVWGNKRGV
ncbi:7-carboxy-7-deazaguanine synthase QueE [Bacillus haikouensis]|jgi:7-carboxy-7-deazaguanine synthase|uniref:7-carboxy-7-deazaguanine synthase QueE n=1 Tax=Bacillus haikouensis TaxID=1510468 RepID=UPI001555ECA9|nr:7-carboxy-7-deazaguanine synthase QueE [Bacillus haikouensis]NQD68661.1 7-carboxy-7-deazaguanine synthase QueE [Bacillus haikouensis]